MRKTWRKSIKLKERFSTTILTIQNKYCEERIQKAIWIILSYHKLFFFFLVTCERRSGRFLWVQLIWPAATSNSSSNSKQGPLTTPTLIPNRRILNKVTKCPILNNNKYCQLTLEQCFAIPQIFVCQDPESDSSKVKFIIPTFYWQPFFLKLFVFTLLESWLNFNNILSSRLSGRHGTHKNFVYSCFAI
jgi:hypothetical protein